MNIHDVAEPSGLDWRGLYRAGGAAALLAGILFRRNLGVEIALFSPQKPPETAGDLFALLQTNRLLGLAYLHIFDVLNYLLLALMFAALFVLLRRAAPGSMAIALVLGLLGVGAYAASNTALSLLALSDRYAAAGEVGRAGLLGAGEALLALNRFSSGAHPASGGFASLLLVAAASLIVSITMLRTRAFNRITAVAGIAASSLDLAYCLAYLFFPAAGADRLAVTFIPAAGLMWMAWHILTGWRLGRLGLENTALSKQGMVVK